LQTNYIEDKKFNEYFNDYKRRIHTIALIQEKLLQSNNFLSLNLSEYIKKISVVLMNSYRDLKVNFKYDLDEINIREDFAIPFGLTINEIISNSLKHAFPQNWSEKKEIEISLRKKQDNSIELSIGDNGAGLPENIDFNNSRSLGLRLINLLVVDQLNGKIDVKKNGGTTITISCKNVYN